MAPDDADNHRSERIRSETYLPPYVSTDDGVPGNLNRSEAKIIETKLEISRFL